MQGLICIDKPVGWTSFDVVNYVRRIVANYEDKKPKAIKVGHTGTLDPFATGLLILLIGKEFTRQATKLSKLDKTYELTMKLGTTSTTGDPEGELKITSQLVPNIQDISESAKKLTGLISQTPPAYSAIKVNGQRAYMLARKGKEVVIEPREVTVKSFKITNYNYPDVDMIADVSSGTYIRSLVESMGQMLGTGAYTKTLRRLSVGGYSINQALEIESLDIKKLKENLENKIN